MQEKTMQQGPTLGRVVHYVQPDHSHLPATVVHVGRKTVNLLARDSDCFRLVKGVRENSAHRPRTWHW